MIATRIASITCLLMALVAVVTNVSFVRGGATPKAKNAVQVGKDRVLINTPVLHTPEEDDEKDAASLDAMQLLPTSMSTNLLINGDTASKFRHPIVTKDGKVLNGDVVIEGEKQPPIEDINEDESDRFMTTRKGKLRVRYINNFLINDPRDRHIVAYEKIPVNPKVQ